MTGHGSTGNVLAALASLFIPGLGQVLQGRASVGAFQFFFAAIMWYFWLGWLIHLWSVIDAAKWTPTEE